MLDAAALAVRRQEILQAAARHGARNVRVFGSVVRGEAREDSDVDLLVGVGTAAGLKPRYRGIILAEAVAL